jgi:hypothetical protein
VATKTFTGELLPGASTTFVILIDITTNSTILAAIALNDPNFQFSFSFEAFVHIFTIFFGGTLPMA